MKKILVTGAGGFVGARILEMWRGRFELSAFPPDFLRTADETAVRRFITAEHPDVIVHTAALSNTQVCQQHPEESFRANVLLPEWVAAAAAETGAKLLSFSSDQVYAGVQQPGPLAEALPLSPANVYGRHKLEAEARVMARCPDAVALRLPWMYDLPGGRLPIRGNLPLNLLQAAKTGEGHRKPSPRDGAARRRLQLRQRERQGYGRYCAVFRTPAPSGCAHRRNGLCPKPRDGRAKAARTWHRVPVYAGGIPAVPCRSRDGHLIPKQKIICKCFSRFFESERHLQMILFFTKFRYAESLSPWERCHRLR